MPEIDTSLQLRLGILTPTMDSAIGAIQDDDVDVLDEVFDKVVAEVDSPSRRIELAQAVTTLRDQGRIPSDPLRPPPSSSWTARSPPSSCPPWPSRSLS